MTAVADPPTTEAPPTPEEPTPAPQLGDYFTETQLRQFLAAINPSRVSQKQGQSHLEAYDVRAHLNRLLGFARWDGEVIESYKLFEEITGDAPTLKPDGKIEDKRKITVGWFCRYRLTIKAPDGTPLAVYTEDATGDAINFPGFKRVGAFDFAIKTSESQALKRCAINLGDQFGLSLYRGGSTGAVVLRTLVGMPEQHETAGQSVDHGAPAVVAEALADGVDPATGQLIEDQAPPAGSTATEQRRSAPAEQTAAPRKAAKPAKHTPAEVVASIAAAGTDEDLTKIEVWLEGKGLLETEAPPGEYTFGQLVQGRRDALRDAAKHPGSERPATPTAAVEAAWAGAKDAAEAAVTPAEAAEPEHPHGWGADADPKDDCKATPARTGVVKSLHQMGVTDDQIAEHFGRKPEHVATKLLTELIRHTISVRNAGRSAS